MSKMVTLVPVPSQPSELLGGLEIEAGSHVFLPGSEPKLYVNLKFERDAELDEMEGCDVVLEKIREVGFKCAGVGKTYKSSALKISDEFSESEVMALTEGLVLGSWAYKSAEADKFAKIEGPSDEKLQKVFIDAKERTEIQNFARFLQEAPSNLMTPQIFADTVKAKVEEMKLENVIVHARDVEWIKAQKMGSFLGVAQGSIEENPPVFLEIHVNKKDDTQPELCFVGKGITFDSGGISLKLDWQGMVSMKSDMGGAAVTAATTLGAAKLRLTEKYMVCLIPLTDNMPDGRALKNGDVITASNGKTIEIFNTDAEGRLVMADALCYADLILKAKNIIDVATLTGSMMVSLGDAACGIFSKSNAIAKCMMESGVNTGDRVYRMPLYKLYEERMTKSDVADTTNLPSCNVRFGGAITAAQFLAQFVTTKNWAHVDIAGIFKNGGGGCKYIAKGSMTGRPVRTMLAFVEEFLK